MMIRRLMAVITAAFVVLVGVPAPAFAAADPVDNYNCVPVDRMHPCLGFTVDPSGFDNMTQAVSAGAVSLTVKVDEIIPAGALSIPPDPTHNLRIGWVYGCSAGGQVTMAHVQGDVDSWASVAVFGWSETLTFQCTGGTVVYAGLFQRDWFSFLGTGEPKDYDLKRFWGVGCPSVYKGSPVSCYEPDGGGGTEPESGIRIDWVAAPGVDQAGIIDGTGNQLNYWRAGWSWLERPCMENQPGVVSGEYHGHAYVTIDGARPWASVPNNNLRAFVAANNWVPTYTAWQVLEAEFFGPSPGNNTSPNERYLLDPQSGPNGHVIAGWCLLHTHTPIEAGSSDYCDSTTVNVQPYPDCWRRITEVTIAGIDIPPAAGAPSCAMVVTDPATWGDQATCEIVLQLRRANEWLQQIAASTSQMPQYAGGGGDDASECDGIAQTVVCLIDGIADVVAGLADLLTTLFAPSTNSYDAVASLRTDFTTVPPGSLLSAGSTAVTSFSTGLASSGCSSMPAMDFGESGIDGLAGVVVQWPSMCGGGAAFGEGAALFQAAYDLVTLFIYGLLGFALWGMARRAFGDRGGS